LSYVATGFLSLMHYRTIPLQLHPNTIKVGPLEHMLQFLHTCCVMESNN